MKNIENQYDGYTPSKRSAENLAIDQETDSQTFRRILSKYSGELIAIVGGIVLTALVVWVYNAVWF